MSVINQMLRDLDKQQGKAGPAVVSQRPSLPRPAASKQKWLLLGFGVAAVGLWFSISVIRQPALVASATTAQNLNNSGQINPEPVSTQKNSGVAKAAPQKADVTASAAPTVEPIAELTATNNTEKLAAVPAPTVATQIAAKQPVATPPAEVTAAPSVEATIPAAQSRSNPDAAELAVSTASDTAQTAAVWPAVTESDNNSYAAAKPAEFLTETAAEPLVAKAPSSMQVEQVVFDSKAQLQRLTEQATVALSNGRWQQLQQHAQQFIQLAPADVKGYQWLAESYRQLQQWQALQQLLQLSAQLKLSSDDLLLQQARLASQLKNWPEAEQALHKIQPGFEAVEVLQLKANALQQQQKLAQALVAWQQLTTLQPGFGRGWLGQALVLDQQGESQQAKLAYQQALTTGGLSAATVQFIQQRLAQAE